MATPKIIETNLKFKNGLSSRSSTKRIILHHAEAKTCTAQQIHQWHLNNGWSGAGYHFLVRKNGEIYRLRPEHTVGAHASGNNSDSIGICFEGSFMSETMSQTQINAGKELVSYLKSKYGITKVQRHKDVGSTSCPGTNFPFDKIANGYVAGWVKDSKGWWYRNADGTWPKSEWLKDEGKWYWFDAKGYAVSSCWKKIGGYWYWFNSLCAMATGWRKVNGLWYYLNPKKNGEFWEGAAHIGWITLSDGTYYLKKKSEGIECSMACNETMTIDGKKCTFDASGRLVS